MAKYLMSVFGPDADYDKDNYGYESPEQMQQSFADTEAFNSKLQERGYFVFADGLSWSMGGESGRTRTESDLNPWRTARGAAGRMPPMGFPRDNRF